MRAQLLSLISKNIENSLTNDLCGVGSSVIIKRYDSTITKSKYGENRTKAYLPGIEVKGILTLNPTTEVLTTAGMENDKVNLLFGCSTKTLIDKGLVIETVTAIGAEYKYLLTNDDTLEVNGSTYDIKRVIPKAYVSGCPVWTMIGAEKIGQ